MRGLLIVAAVVAVLAVVLVAANAILEGRIEGDAADALSDAIAERTGGRPEQVSVELQGWPAALRLLAGGRPDAVATAVDVPVPDGDGSVSRIRMDFSRVDADAGDLLGSSSGGLPFTAENGRFTAVLEEDDLNRIIAAPGFIERLEIDDGLVRALLSQPAGVGSPPGELGMTAEVGMPTGDDRSQLILRPDSPPATPPGVNLDLSGATLTISLDFLPVGIEVDGVTLRDESLLAEGTVDVDALAGS